MMDQNIWISFLKYWVGTKCIIRLRNTFFFLNIYEQFSILFMAIVKSMIPTWYLFPHLRLKCAWSLHAFVSFYKIGQSPPPTFLQWKLNILKLEFLILFIPTLQFNLLIRPSSLVWTIISAFMDYANTRRILLFYLLDEYIHFSWCCCILHYQLLF